jgi:hypothetical protein
MDPSPTKDHEKLKTLTLNKDTMVNVFISVPLIWACGPITLSATMGLDAPSSTPPSPLSQRKFPIGVIQSRPRDDMPTPFVPLPQSLAPQIMRAPTHVRIMELRK